MTKGVYRIAAYICVLASVAAVAQQPADTKRTRDVLRLREFKALGNSTKVKTPEFRSNIGRGRKPQQDWVMLSVTYDTAPDWIDELDFRYYVLTSQRVEGKTMYTLFSKSVRYADIEKGREHMSTVFLHPKAIGRYGMPVAAAVEIRHAGELVAGDTADGAIRMPGRWWTSKEVLDREDVQAKQGYLMSRNETPWALVNIDDYEVIK